MHEFKIKSARIRRFLEW